MVETSMTHERKTSKSRRSAMIFPMSLSLSAVIFLVSVGVGIFPSAQPASAKPPSKILPEIFGKSEAQRKDVARRIEMGLNYLEKTQRGNGQWLNTAGYGSYPVVMTSLASLAMMAGGSTPETGPYCRSVSKALDYVMNIAEGNMAKRKDKQAMIGGDNEGRSMYGHGFGMLFLAQCYGMENSMKPDRAKRLKKVLDGAVLLTANSQSKKGGWIYTPDGRDDEGSVTVTQLQALRACRNAGIKVPKKVIEDSVAYLKLCQNADGGISYSARSRGSSRPALSAAGIACFYSAGLYDRKTGGKGPEAQMVERLVKYCRGKIGVENTSGHYFYTHFYYAQAMFQRGGAEWKRYFPQIVRKFCSNQMQSSDGNWASDGVGEVYGTAMACLILQLPYGYLPIMQR